MYFVSKPEIDAPFKSAPLLAPAAAAPEAHRYFINAPTDFLSIGGLSLFLLAALSYLFPSAHPVPDQLYRFSTALLWLGNWPHFAASSYRLYHTRSNIEQYPLTALWVPLVVLTGVIASLASPYVLGPFFVKLYLIWSPFHYSGQSLGISLIYARREGFLFGKLERWSLTGFIFGTFLAANARAETSLQMRSFYGILYPGFGMPTFVADALTWAMYACGTVFILCALRWSIRNRRALPLMVGLPAIAQFAWFVIGNSIPSFNAFVPFFHSLQYLLIAWAMQMKEAMQEKEAQPSGNFVFSETAWWSLGIFLGGILLFWVLPRVGTLAGIDLNIAEPIIIAGVQIHHFFVDGVIWKLRNPKVRSPLLVNIEDLIRRPIPAI